MKVLEINIPGDPCSPRYMDVKNRHKIPKEMLQAGIAVEEKEVTKEEYKLLNIMTGFVTKEEMDQSIKNEQPKQKSKSKSDLKMFLLYWNDSSIPERVLATDINDAFFYKSTHHSFTTPRDPDDLDSWEEVPDSTPKEKLENINEVLNELLEGLYMASFDSQEERVIRTSIEKFKIKYEGWKRGETNGIYDPNRMGYGMEFIFKNYNCIDEGCTGLKKRIIAKNPLSPRLTEYVKTGFTALNIIRKMAGVRI